MNFLIGGILTERGGMKILAEEDLKGRRMSEQIGHMAIEHYIVGPIKDCPKCKRLGLPDAYERLVEVKWETQEGHS